MIEIESYGQLLSLIRSRTKITVVDFYANWCGPCQQLKPHYERLAQLFDPNKVVFCKCNVDNQRECARHYDVQSIPTIVVALNNEVILRSVGGDLNLVERNISLSLSLLPQGGQTAAAHSSSSAEHAASAVQNLFAEQMLRAGRARAEKDQIAEKDSCDAAYAQLHESAKGEPFGLLLLPYLASEAASTLALEALVRNIQLRATPQCYDAELLVNQVLRYVIEMLAALRWSDIATVQMLQHAVLALVQCPATLPIVLRSPLFFSEGIRTGLQLERCTLLGAFFGLGPAPRRSSYVHSQRGAMRNWMVLMHQFPAGDQERNAREVFQTQQTVELLSALNYKLVRALLVSKTARDATLLYLGRALYLNEDYQKTVHNNAPLSSQYFMVQLQSVLIDAALPMFTTSFQPGVVPAYYLLEETNTQGGFAGSDGAVSGAAEQTATTMPADAETRGGGQGLPRAVVRFGAADMERIAHYDEDHPLPALPAAVSSQSGLAAYKPVVHLFFLAARAVALCAAIFTDEHERAARSTSYAGLPAQERNIYLASQCLLEGLLGGASLGRNRLQLLNGVAHWLLHVMKVDASGKLPDEPPAEWSYLPQQLVDSVIRATRLAPVDGVYADGMIGLLLVLMGNTHYFPKPHTHVLFPTYLTSLLREHETRKALEQHPWFADHIVRACINCYIAVEKATYERVNVRFELSMCLKQFLASDALCAPVRAELEQEGSTVLERFSHMAVAEVNEAVDQLIETLTKMNKMVKAGANLAEDAPPTEEGGTSANDNAENANEEANDEEDDDEGDGGAADNEAANHGGGGDEQQRRRRRRRAGRSYHQMGLTLRSYIMLFNESMDMFIQLSVQFPKGVSQNMVAMQISQMLARSLVAFGGPNSKNLKIEHNERYAFHPREILARLVSCLTHFRRSRNFMRSLCQCGIPLSDIRATMAAVVERRLVSEDLAWKLSEMSSVLETLSREVDEEEELWEDAPDFALDALLSTPLVHPVALPAEVKSLDDLVYVNRDTIHHFLLSESKHPFTKEYLDEDMVVQFNARPDVVAARNKVMHAIATWLQEAKQRRKNEQKAAAAE